MNKQQAKPEIIWTRLGATKQENSATGVITTLKRFLERSKDG